MSSDTSLRDKIRAEAVNYTGYRLSRNPFPETGKAPAHPSFCAGRTKVLEKIYDLIADVYNQESVSGLVILGIYGGGKTHVLRYVSDKINNELRDIPSGGAMAVYIEKPQTGVLHIYSEFMSAIGNDFYTELVWKAISASLEKDIRDNKITVELLAPTTKSLESYMTYEKISLLDIFASAKSLREYTSKGQINKKRVKAILEKYLSNYVPAKDVATCSIELLLADDLQTLNECWNFLTGNRVSKDFQTSMGLSKASLSVLDINKSVFKSILGVCRAYGFKAIFLLLDEVEAFAKLGPQTRFTALDEFRGFFDSIPSSFGVVLACVPRDWSQIVNTLPALKDRIRHVADLGYMDPDEAIELVKAYLLTAREESNKNDLYPFSRETIVEICKLKTGIVRYIVESCYVLLREGAKQNFAPITRAFVLKYIKPEAQSLA